MRSYNNIILRFDHALLYYYAMDGLIHENNKTKPVIVTRYYFKNDIYIDHRIKDTLGITG